MDLERLAGALGVDLGLLIVGSDCAREAQW